jgi:hypothetical protein
MSLVRKENQKFSVVYSGKDPLLNLQNGEINGKL